MNARISPIETAYRGHRFRSRLEARWAVFFHTAGIDYEYELEGFALPSGSAYLPDFYLPSIRLFVEVKPTREIPLDDLKKMAEFAIQDGDHIDGNGLLLIMGTPTSETMVLIDRRSVEDPGSWSDCEYEMTDAEVSEMQVDMLIHFAEVGFGLTPIRSEAPQEWSLAYKALPPPCYVSLSQALLKAKQARFEFGEEG